MGVSHPGGAREPRTGCSAIRGGWLRCAAEGSVYLRRQHQSQPVCKVCTGPPPSPPDKKGLLFNAEPLIIATVAALSDRWFSA